ncbi:hypothetical protein FSARC_4545 [Fusarium sarcochroum]|uniref:Protein kinase domain-containing protein n=1 Tax=Fusarium sarcochroum TaxID=1208366 RepID=A0A8H4XBE9_9HYPO|nr:hypothetical protein FSARC_4545 [Fusarium sarcochroum]
MDFSSAFTFRERPQQQDPDSTGHDTPVAPQSAGTNCPHFAGFMAVSFANDDNELGLHPVITNTAPDFQDVSLGGGSFDVRKVKASSFPLGLSTSIFTNREFVAVKHPRIQDDNTVSFGDIALELQILRHPPIRKHENIVDLLAVMYHDTGNEEGIRVLPALVLEYAEHGSVKAFQEAGYGTSLEEKLSIALDTARGLEALHDSEIVHGDIKPSNLLVFKHPTRKYIVKLSDFGFAMPIEGGQLIGSTEVYRAPEADGGLLPSQYLRQQDVYSFGLTLWTILSDGFPFYASLPDGERLENARKIKNTNLLASLAACNILHRLRNESYPLMTLVKVIIICLQLSPAKRFSNMTKIINHLEITQSIIKSRNGHDPPDAGGLRTASKLLLKVVSEAKIPASTEEEAERTILNGLITLASVFLSKELGLQGSAMNLDPQQFCSIITQFVPTAHNRFYSFFDEDEMPLKNALEMMSKGKLERTMAELLDGSANPSDGGTSRPFSARNACQLIVDCAGFLAEPINDASSASATSQSGSKPVHLLRDEEFVPDISKVSNILQKTPKLVQAAIAESLKNIYSTSASQTEKSQTALSLTYAYIDGIGLQYDLKLAAYYVLQAAHLGLEKARTLYISIFCHVPDLDTPDQDTLRTWTLDSAEAGNPTALQNLKDYWPSDWQKVTQTAQQKELNRIGVDPDACEDIASMLQSLSLEDVELSQAQALLLWSIVTDKPEFTASCLDQNPELGQTTLQNGETPLFTAARLGRKNVLKTILEHPNCKNAAELTDEKGVTALHWLCSFADEDHEAVSTLLLSKGADPNSPACSLLFSHYGVKLNDNDLLIQTPLHWAVTQNRLSAVDALLKSGADPNFSMEAGDNEAPNVTPLELACRLCYSPVVSRLLQENSARQVVNAPKPMLNGNDLMFRPLFQVVRGDSRWQRLRLLGVDFESESKKTMKALIDNGATTDAVLQINAIKLPAVFATAYHQCSSDIMVSGLELGFADQIDARFKGMSSGGTALFLAITHGDRAMFKALLDAGADATAVDNDGLNPLHRAAKETDDLYFAKVLLEKGLPVDPVDPKIPSAFFFAVYCGNLSIARYLYDQGADRDRVSTSIKRSILGEMLFRHTRNALRRAKFLLSLPDREGSDGFMVTIDESTRYSLFHFAIPYVSEFAEDNEITGIMVAEILRRYHDQEQLDNTAGPHQMTALAMAAEAGNYFVVRRLLEYGASPNIPDQYGRTALDLVHKRYCFPEQTPAIEQADHKDDLLVEKILRAVNENTSESLALLYSHKAETRTWKTPTWLDSDPGHRSLGWVLERLRKNSGSS